MGYRVHVELLVPETFDLHDKVLQVLNLIETYCPAGMPRRYGSTEPLRGLYDPAKPYEFLAAIDGSIHWDAQSSGCEGSLYLPRGKKMTHACMQIRLNLKESSRQDINSFLKEGAFHLGADFGYIHLPTGGEIETLLATRTGTCLGGESYIMFVPVLHLRHYIPDLYWVTVFGPPYIELFGKERLLSAPAPIVEELDESHVYIQLSDSPLDLLDDFAAVDAVRKRVKEHLNNDSFFDLNAQPTHVYNVPEFHLEEDESAASTEAVKPRELAQPTLFDEELSEQLSTSMESAAQEAIVVAKELGGVDLDFSEASVQNVERILAERYDTRIVGRELMPKEIETYSRLFGAYIGEVLRRRWNGGWFWENATGAEPVIALRLGSKTVFPTIKVYKRLTQGSGDDVWFYFGAISSMLGEAE